MYNVLGSHDTERILTKVDGSLPLTRLAFLFLLTFPGAPSIYYGDEIGMAGGKDPDCRAAFPWDGKQWDHSLREYVKNLVSLRKRVKALRAGSFRWLLQDDDQSSAAFVRSVGDQHVIVVMNAGDHPSHIRVPVSDLSWADGCEVKDLLKKRALCVAGGKVELDLNGYEGAVLTNNH
jgi:glycosidase